MTVYSIVLIYQVIMTLFSVGAILLTVRQWKEEMSRSLLFIGMLAFLSNLGYLLELMADTTGELMLAARVQYCGSAFIFTTVTIFIWKYCGKKIPRPLICILAAWNSMILLSVWISGINPFFSNEIIFVQGKYLSYGSNGNRILFYVNLAIILAQMLCCIAMIYLIYKKSRNKKFKKRCLFLIGGITLIIAACVIQASNVLGGFDPVPGVEIIAVLIFEMTVVAVRIFDNQNVLYSHIIDGLKEPVIIADQDYRFIEANKKAVEVFPHLGELKRGDEITDSLLMYTFKTKKDGDIISDEFIMHTDVQKIVHRNVVQGYAMLLFDLTKERLQLEELQILKVEADMANQAKSDFLAKMSHEIRTPINGILGMNEMILRESKEPEVRKYSHDIKSAAKSLLGIINEILDSSKIESGKMQIVPSDYEMGSVLVDLYNMVGIRATEKKLALSFDIDETIPSEYYGDDMRIKQVLVNLLSNAVKYTKEGSVKMKLTGRQDGEYEVLKFVVTDTGIGIKKEDISKIYSDYVRINEEKNRYVEGTGLGMNITVQLLALMGSRLNVESEYGKGSTFFFELRQKIVNEEPLGTFCIDMDQLDTGTYIEHFVAPAAKILVVDDNDLNRSVFRNLLKSTGIQIWDVDSGKACLKIITEQEFDLIFLDHMMPEMDGVETFHAMKELEGNRCKNTPVIMLTANAVKGAKEKYLEEGFNDFLTKPVMPDKLDEMVTAYLPENLIEYRTDEKEDEVIEIPELEEFDCEYALKLLKDKKLLRDTMIDFCKTLPAIEQKLNGFLDGILQEEALTGYRIEVHSLKSTAATVGAILLSKLARLSEVAAKEKNIEKIKRLHPILMEEIEKHRERLSVLLPKQVKTVPTDLKELLPYFEALKDSLLDGDYNACDEVVREITKYQYPAGLEEQVEQLADYILNLMDDEAITVLNDIMAVIREVL